MNKKLVKSSALIFLSLFSVLPSVVVVVVDVVVVVVLLFVLPQTNESMLATSFIIHGGGEEKTASGRWSFSHSVAFMRVISLCFSTRLDSTRFDSIRLDKSKQIERSTITCCRLVLFIYSASIDDDGLRQLNYYVSQSKNG